MLDFFNMADAEPAAIRAISPIHNIPDTSERPLPHYLTRGVNDPIITDEGARAYMDALAAAGQVVEYVQIGGATHAFLDWKPNEAVVATFKKYGAYYCGQMEHFFDSVFYRGN